MAFLVVVILAGVHDSHPRETFAVLSIAGIFQVAFATRDGDFLAFAKKYGPKLLAYFVAYCALGAVCLPLRFWYFVYMREGDALVHEGFDACRTIDDDTVKRFDCYFSGLQAIQSTLLIWFSYWPLNIIKTLTADPLHIVGIWVMNQIKYLFVYILDHAGNHQDKTFL